MGINQEIYQLLTGTTGVTQYITDVYKEVLPENHTSDAIVFACDVEAQNESLCGKIWSRVYQVSIVVFAQDEEVCDALHPIIISTMKGYASDNVDGIDFRRDFFEYDDELMLHILRMDFVATYYLEE